MVSIILDWQNISCCTRWWYVVHSSHHVLSTSRLSSGSMAVRFTCCELSSKAEEHDMTLHAFRDDAQSYLHCCREDMTPTINQLEHYILDIGHWMSISQLKVNMDKTELLWAGRLSSFGSQGYLATLKYKQQNYSSEGTSAFSTLEVFHIMHYVFTHPTSEHDRHSHSTC